MREAPGGQPCQAKVGEPHVPAVALAHVLRTRKLATAASALMAAMGVGVYFAPGQMLAMAIMAAALCGHHAWSSNVFRNRSAV